MSDVAINVENVGKRYRIGQLNPYGTLREALVDAVAWPFRRGRRAATSESSNGTGHIWALRGVSLQVKWGEVVGVIGANGAGKSTLLKILTRITEPTEGRAEISGRVRSLLEVGTGFHPELTGRENVYLSGAILGMRKAEIDQQFDRIVSFAGVERFIDTPVKRYSSGMQVRLGFSVAAHLQTEILLIDEVLAVGDAEFQKRCLGRMQDVAGEGRTVLFVSHNMGAVQRLCGRGILLKEGKIAADGTIDAVVKHYLATAFSSQGERVWTDLGQAPGNDVVRLRVVRLRDRDGAVRAQFDVRDPIFVEIEYEVLKDGHQISAALEFINELGLNLFVALDECIQGPWGAQPPRSRGVYRSTCLVPGDFLQDGSVSINVRLFSPPDRPNDRPHVRELDVVRFSVHDAMDQRGVRGSFPYEWGSPAVRPRLAWQTQPLSSERVGPRS